MQWIIRRQRLLNQFKSWVDLLADLISQLTNREFNWITEIERARDLTIHEADQTLHQILHVAKTARLTSIAIQSERFTAEGLHDEIAHHTTIIRQHSRTIGVENSGHTNLTAMHTLVVKAKGFSNTFAFVVTGANTMGVHIAPVTLRLRVHLGIAIHLTSAS